MPNWMHSLAQLPLANHARPARGMSAAHISPAAQFDALARMAAATQTERLRDADQARRAAGQGHVPVPAPRLTD